MLGLVGTTLVEIRDLLAARTTQREKVPRSGCCRLMKGSEFTDACTGKRTITEVDGDISCMLAMDHCHESGGAYFGDGIACHEINSIAWTKFEY